MSILTLQEAADTLGYNSPDEMPGRVSSILIPAIDEYIKTATGKDWGGSPSDPVAKIAASILLVQWFENPAMLGQSGENNYGLTNQLAQLHAKALAEGDSI